MKELQWRIPGTARIHGVSVGVLPLRPRPSALGARRSDVTPTTPLHTERPFSSTSWIAHLRSSKLRHRDAGGQRPGGDSHRLGRGRGADGGRREPARAHGPGDAGGGAAAHARARAIRGGPEPHRRHQPVPQRPVPPRPGDRAHRDERGLREPHQLPGLDRSEPRPHEAIRTSWIERKRANPDKHFSVSGFCSADYTRDLEAMGTPVYEEARHATRAVAAPAGFARSFRERRPRPAVPAPASLPAGPVNEISALKVLAAAGVPIVPARQV